MVNYLELPVGDNTPEVVNAVIEIPADGVNKYEYDKKLHVFRLDRNLYSPVHYPGDYGFIPSTLSDDGDPLDVLVLAAEPVYPLTLVKARPIGLMTMMDQDELDYKIIAVGVHDPEYNTYHDVRELPQHRLAVIRRFFEDYKALENKRVVVDDISPAIEAIPVIEKALNVYRDWAKAGK